MIILFIVINYKLSKIFRLKYKSNVKAQMCSCLRMGFTECFETCSKQDVENKHIECNDC